jgi:hypothetical protein
MPRKLQLAVAVAASVATTALTMSALAIAEGDNSPAKPPPGVSTKPIGPTEFKACLTAAGVTVPDGLEPIELKQFIGENAAARTALDACFPSPTKSDAGTADKVEGICKTEPGDPGQSALRTHRKAAAKAQAAASSLR